MLAPPPPPSRQEFSAMATQFSGRENAHALNIQRRGAQRPGATILSGIKRIIIYRDNEGDKTLRVMR